jgi:hypothetical protein
VADGAGSAPQAAAGSALAVRGAAEAVRSRQAELGGDLSDDAWRQVLSDALTAARAAVETEAVLTGAPLQDFASTLILVVARPRVAAAAQIGDGASVLADAGGNLHLLTLPARTEYLNETTFLTSAEGLATAQYQVWRGKVAGIAALSDGLETLALKLAEGRAHAPFFTPLFRFVAESTHEAQAAEQFQQFLLSRRVRERTDDDVTLVLGRWVH